MNLKRVLLLLSLFCAALPTFAQTPTTFTYQGRLYNNGVLANGAHTLRITPYNALSGGSTLAPPFTTPSLDVVDGIFSTTLDFGSAVFLGSPVWLSIEVQAPASSFITLAPRQPVTPTPYAINADKLDGLDAAQVGNRAFADFYALMPGDNVVTIGSGGDVDFPRNGPASGGISRVSDDAFVLEAIGTYQVTFQVSVSEPGQLILTLNNLDLPYTVVGRASSSNQLAGTFLVTTTVAASLLTVRNPAGNFQALTMTPNAGGTRPVSAHLLIVQLR